jgi:transcriptional regulator with XRE-family HTH domain
MARPKAKQNIGKIIREQRKSIPLSLKRLSRMSGVSLAHLSRIEKGERSPSPHTLQLIAQPLGFDVNELLIIAGYLSPGPLVSSEEERNKLRAEVKLLLRRTVSDNKRISQIVNRLLLST